MNLRPVDAENCDMGTCAKSWFYTDWGNKVGVNSQWETQQPSFITYRGSHCTGLSSCVKQLLSISRFQRDLLIITILTAWTCLLLLSALMMVTHDDPLLLPTVSLLGVALIYDDMTALLK